MPHSSQFSMNKSIIGLFDHLPMVIFYMKDAQGAFIRCNPRFEEFHGLTHGAGIGLDDFSLHHPAIASRYRTEDRKIMETGKPATNRIWLVPGASDFGKRFREIETVTPRQYRAQLQKLILETPV